MKILFLDIDGVLNSAATFTKKAEDMCPLDQYMAFLIGRIVINTDCWIVLSSSWRNHPDGVKAVEKCLAIKVLDKTCRSWYDLENDHHSWRGEEIAKWLDVHPEVTRYAILDDSIDMLVEQAPNFFRTQWKEGLTDEIARAVIKHFNE